MTSDRDPPRLRTLKNELSPELWRALEDTSEDNATAAELARLSGQVLGAVAESERALHRSRRSPRARTPRGRIAGVAFTFALGAAAGVLGSNAVLLLRASSQRPQRSSASSTRQPAFEDRTATAPSGGSASSELPPTEASPPVQPAIQESARLAQLNPSAETTSEEPSSPPATGARDELALLARAQSALASNPGLALALASDHERKFPNGILVQEREVVAIDALLRLRRPAEANRRAERFHQQFPTSVHGRRVDVLLANGEPSK